MTNPGLLFERRIAWLLAAATSLTQAATPAWQFHELDPIVGQAYFDGRAVLVEDFDGDGLADAMLTANVFNSYPMLITVGKRGENVGIKHAQPIEDAYYRRILSIKSDGTLRMLTVNSTGFVQIYEGWPPRRQHDYQTMYQIKTAASGDVDADGRDELLVLTDDSLRIYDALTGQPGAVYPVEGATDVAVMQLDADAALEIILTGSRGLVLDGATHATDWERPGGFGELLTTGRFDVSQNAQWAGVRVPAQFTLFGSQPWGVLWGGSVVSSSRLIESGDVTNAGRDALLLGLHDSVVAIDGQTHQELYSIGIAASGLGVGDFDGDGRNDLLLSESTSFDRPMLTISEGHSGKPYWGQLMATNSFSATAIGDIDGDGRLELVASAGGLASGSGIDTLAVFDLASGIERWRSRFSHQTAEPFSLSATTITLMPKPGAAGMDIVFAGAAYDGRILVVDGVTMEPRLQIGDEPESERPLANRRVVAMALSDYDDDGMEDFVAGTQPGDGGFSQGARLHVFSGVDGRLLWESNTMSPAQPRLNGLFILEGDQTSSEDEIVAVLDGGLRAYGQTSGLLNWTLSVPAQGALLLPNGRAGREIAVFSEDGSIAYYDADTRAELRTMTMPEPVRALRTLDGSPDRLIALTAGKLWVVNGSTGSIVGEGRSFHPLPSPLPPPTVHSDGSGWHVTFGDRSMLYRFRLTYDEMVFADGFDGS